MTYLIKIMLNFLVAMTQSFKGFALGSSRFNIQTIKSQTLYLPIKNGFPDFEAMELIISAVIKLVIKDVVLYAEKKSEQLKLS